MTPVALHHQISGPEGAPVVLLGGSLGTTLAMWAPQVAALSATHRVVAFDHRGHGGSPVPEGPYALDDLGGDVVALLDRLGVERASYAGLSIGGMVGMWLGVNAADRIDRLALLCTSAHLPPAEGWVERAGAVRAAQDVGVVADAVMTRWLTPAFAAAQPGVAQRLRGMLVATSPDGYAACCAAIGAMDQREAISAVRAPTLVVSAAQDHATPPEHGRAIAGAIPGARFELLDPGAHVASVERADAVSALLIAHLDPAEHP